MDPRVGATDHLTGFYENFVSYIPCSGNEKIIIVDGSLVPIVRKGQNFPFEGLSLQNVLHVPKISYNLLSISKITPKLNCKATFLPKFVSFQDLSSGRMIDTAWYSRGPISLMMIPPVVVSFGPVYCHHILLFFNKIVCCVIFGWATQTLNI